MDAIQTVEHWQTKLNEARRSLASFEASMGRRALAGDGAALAAELGRLQAAVVVAEAAHKAAVAAAPDPRITATRKRLTAAQEALSAVNGELAEVEAILAEVQPKYNAAMARGIALSNRAKSLEWSVMTIGSELGRLERGNG
jgi:capsule polysaccharide export protein KpsE/RkpR